MHFSHADAEDTERDPVTRARTINDTVDLGTFECYQRPATAVERGNITDYPPDL